MLIQSSRKFILQYSPWFSDIPSLCPGASWCWVNIEQTHVISVNTTLFLVSQGTDEAVITQSGETLLSVKGGCQCTNPVTIKKTQVWLFRLKAAVFLRLEQCWRPLTLSITQHRPAIHGRTTVRCFHQGQHTVFIFLRGKTEPFILTQTSSERLGVVAGMGVG